MPDGGFLPRSFEWNRLPSYDLERTRPRSRPAGRCRSSEEEGFTASRFAAFCRCARTGDNADLHEDRLGQQTLPEGDPECGSTKRERRFIGSATSFGWTNADLAPVQMIAPVLRNVCTSVGGWVLEDRESSIEI